MFYKIACHLIFLSMLSSISFSNAHAGITGSKHDFSGFGWSVGQICIVCHTPHAAQTAIAAPLWNHEETSATFTIYTSSTLTAIPGQPGDVSKICLSCHDGSVAIDNFGGNSGNQLINGKALIGTDLSNDHPVGISWTHKEINSCIDCHNLRNPKARVLPFFNGKVECASCHDPHNNVTAGNLKMLRKTNSGSALCLVCHHK